MTKFKKGTPWLVLTPEMKQFEKKTGKSAVFRGKITGQFEYYIWQEEKKKTLKPKPQLTRGLKEIKSDKLKRIEKEYNRLTKLRKDELFRIVQQSSRLDISHIKQEDKYTIMNFILENEFGRKNMEEFEKHLSEPKPPTKKPQLIKGLNEIKNDESELYIVRRQSIPTGSKKDKQWKFYVKIGKEKVYIAIEDGSQRLVRLDGDKTMLRTHLKWRYSIKYNSDGIAYTLGVKSIEHKYIKYDHGYFVSNITDIVVDKMNILSKHYKSASKFSMPIKKVK